jgi:hypothetical protein
VPSAGADASVETNVALLLSGSATDDGLPVTPGMLSYQWVKSNGPGDVDFQTPESTSTQAIFATAGVYQLLLIASDGAIATADPITVTVTEPVLSPIGTWRQLHFGSPENSGDAADDYDFDGDGLVNLIEYALGTDPKSLSSSPAAQRVEITGQQYLQIQWTRPNNRTDITTLGEITNDLTPLSWTFAPAEVLTIITPAGEGLEAVTIRDASPLSPGSKRFLRARIERTPP